MPTAAGESASEATRQALCARRSRLYVRDLRDHQRVPRSLRRDNLEISTHLFQRLVSCLNRHAKQAVVPIIFGTGRSLMRKLLGEAQSYLKKRLKIELAIEPKGLRRTKWVFRA